MKIAIGNLKGGVGKTTTSVFLALGLAQQGRTLLIDADPAQSSAFRWSEVAEDWPNNCVVVAVNSRRLTQRIEQLTAGSNFEHVIIDSGPKNPGMLGEAMVFCEHLVVPVSPRPLDLAELPSTFELAAEVDSHSPLLASVLLVQVRAGTRSATDARDALQDMNYPVLRSQIRLREQFSLAYGTVPTDLAEYEDVLIELQKDEG